jgi:hypothetical protein
MPVGQSVTGTVVDKRPYGVWVDLGVGFPALLEVPSIAGMTREMYQAGDWCPIGSEVTASVLAFRDSGFQIYLGQVVRTGTAPAS